jgi:ribosomal protein S13
MESLKGSIVETIFRNDENGYTVALLETADEVITLTGTFAGDISGESIEVFGKRVKHPKYGEQFQVEMYTTLLPTGLDQIENYLSSGLIKGVGKHTAKKIVEAFKEDTFDIIQKTPEKLTLVEGIGEKKAQMIAKSFQDQADLKEIMMFLQNHNISTNYSIKIYKEYGKNTINVIKDNPYRLAEDIYGIGFKLADKIASSLGVEKDSPYRISSGVKYVLLEYALRGHTYAPYKSLVKATGDLLETSIENIEDEIRNMAFTDKIHIETLDSEPVVYYLPYQNNQFFCPCYGRIEQIPRKQHGRPPYKGHDYGGKLASLALMHRSCIGKYQFIQLAEGIYNFFFIIKQNMHFLLIIIYEYNTSYIPVVYALSPDKTVIRKLPFCLIIVFYLHNLVPGTEGVLAECFFLFKLGRRVNRCLNFLIQLYYAGIPLFHGRKHLYIPYGNKTVLGRQTVNIEVNYQVGDIADIVCSDKIKVGIFFV